MKIAPSILNADFAHFQSELDSLVAADRIHLDIMDGRYVPNLTFGSSILGSITWPKAIEAHLMCDEPQQLFDGFIDLGCMGITFHIENTGQIAKEYLRYLKTRDVAPGLAIDGYTSTDMVDDEALGLCEQIVLMSVKAGFGGQAFMPEVYDKVKMLRQRGYKGEIEIDGGVNLDNAPNLKEAGADIVVVGSFLMKKPQDARAEIIRQFQDV